MSRMWNVTTQDALSAKLAGRISLGTRGLMQACATGSSAAPASRSRASASGCMSYGVPDRGNHPWTLDEEASRPFIQQALEAGINFFDTANVYSDGTSEEIVGRALADFADRDEVVLATKVHGRMRQGPNGARPVAQGDHDRDRRTACAGSAPTTSTSTRSTAGTRTRRSRRRWRRCTTSSRPARPATSAPRRCTPGSSPRRCTSPSGNGWTPFVVDAEPLQPALPRGGAGDAAALRRPGRRRDPVEPAGPRPADPRLGRRPPRAARPTSSARRCTTPRATGAIVERVAEIAADARRVRGRRSRWPGCCRKPVVTAPIVGATKPQHLDDAVAAVDLELTADEIARLEEPYTPHAGGRLRLTPVSRSDRLGHPQVGDDEVELGDVGDRPVPICRRTPRAVALARRLACAMSCGLS